MRYLEIPKLPEDPTDMNQYYEDAVRKLNRPCSVKSENEDIYYGAELDCLLPNTENTIVRTELPEARDYLRRSRELGEILDESDGDEGQISAFVRGSAAGLLLVEEVHARNLMKQQILTAVAMTKIMRDEMIIPEYPSQPIDKSEYANRAIDVVNDGLDIVGQQAREMINKWAHNYEPENRLAFHMGVGASALLGYKAHQEAYHAQEVRKLEGQILAVTSGYVDWDKELQKLNNSSSRS